MCGMGLGYGVVVGFVWSTFSPPTLTHPISYLTHLTTPLPPSTQLNHPHSNPTVPHPPRHPTQNPLPLPIHGSHFYRMSTYPYPILTHHDFPFPTLSTHRNPSPYSNLPVLPIPSHRRPYSTLPYLHSSHRYSANLR